MNIGLKLNINVAAALWSASVINALTDQGAEGFSSQALTLEEKNSPAASG